MNGAREDGAGPAHGWGCDGLRPARGAHGRHVRPGAGGNVVALGNGVGTGVGVGIGVGAWHRLGGGSASGPVSRVLSWTTIDPGPPLPTASNGLPGSPDGTGRTVEPPCGNSSSSIWPFSGRGLPCRRRHRHRGGLLPHRFTLACASLAEGHRRSVLCCAFPGFAPGGRYPPSCPVEPGLSSKTSRSSRSPGPLARASYQSRRFLLSFHHSRHSWGRVSVCSPVRDWRALRTDLAYTFQCFFIFEAMTLSSGRMEYMRLYVAV